MQPEVWWQSSSVVNCDVLYMCCGVAVVPEGVITNRKKTDRFRPDDDGVVENHNVGYYINRIQSQS